MKINESFDDHIEHVFSCAKKLIEIEYWDNISQRDLENWICNFTSREERYLAAAILYTLIFRNYKSTSTLGQNIFHIILPQILDENNIYSSTSIKEWLEKLNSVHCRTLPFRFSAIDDVDDRGAKSSSNILTQLKNKFFDNNLSINSHNIPFHINKGIKAVIFFDDIIGTGTQFEGFYLDRGLDKVEAKIIYIPFATTKHAKDILEGRYANLIISPVEFIEPSNSFFCEHNEFLCNIEGYTPDDFKEYYLKVCEQKKINLNGNLGVGGLELTYVFNSSTPNNNIAMLMHKSDTWSGLFKR
jgi:hypothetical protein